MLLPGFEAEKPLPRGGSGIGVGVEDTAVARVDPRQRMLPFPGQRWEFEGQESGGGRLPPNDDLLDAPALTRGRVAGETARREAEKRQREMFKRSRLSVERRALPEGLRDMPTRAQLPSGPSGAAKAPSVARAMLSMKRHHLFDSVEDLPPLVDEGRTFADAERARAERAALRTFEEGSDQFDQKRWTLSQKTAKGKKYTRSDARAFATMLLGDNRALSGTDFRKQLEILGEKTRGALMPYKTEGVRQLLQQYKGPIDLGGFETEGDLIRAVLPEHASLWEERMRKNISDNLKKGGLSKIKALPTEFVDDVREYSRRAQDLMKRGHYRAAEQYIDAAGILVREGQELAVLRVEPEEKTLLARDLRADQRVQEKVQQADNLLVEGTNLSPEQREAAGFLSEDQIARRKGEVGAYKLEQARLILESDNNLDSKEIQRISGYLDKGKLPPEWRGLSPAEMGVMAEASGNYGNDFDSTEKAAYRQRLEAAGADDIDSKVQNAGKRRRAADTLFGGDKGLIEELPRHREIVKQDLPLAASEMRRRMYEQSIRPDVRKRIRVSNPDGGLPLNPMAELLEEMERQKAYVHRQLFQAQQSADVKKMPRSYLQWVQEALDGKGKLVSLDGRVIPNTPWRANNFRNSPSGLGGSWRDDVIRMAYYEQAGELSGGSTVQLRKMLSRPTPTVKGKVGKSILSLLRALL